MRKGFELRVLESRSWTYTSGFRITVPLGQVRPRPYGMMRVWEGACRWAPALGVPATMFSSGYGKKWFLSAFRRGPQLHDKG